MTPFSTSTPALATGEPPPGIDVGDLLYDIGTLLSATGTVLHLSSHDFVETKDVRPHVEMVLSTTGYILRELSEEG
jgi:hypothetical protein